METVLTIIAVAWLIRSYWRRASGDTWPQALFWPLRILRRR